MGTTNFKLIGLLLLLVAGIACLGYAAYQLIIGTFSGDQILGIRCIITGILIQISFSVIEIRSERRKMAF